MAPSNDTIIRSAPRLGTRGLLRVEDQLDGTLKRSIIRGPGGGVHVERYLDDLQENVDKLKERFTAEYAASSEATTVLRHSSDIQRFMASQPPNFDGASEWNRLAASLGELAAVCGTTMPLPQPLGLAKSARPPSPVQIRAAPPKFPTKFRD